MGEFQLKVVELMKKYRKGKSDKRAEVGLLDSRGFSIEYRDFQYG